MTDSERTARWLDKRGITVTKAIDPVDGSTIEVVDLAQLSKLAEGTKEMVSVPRDLLRYAAVALEASSDRGDQYTAERIRDAIHPGLKELKDERARLRRDLKARLFHIHYGLNPRPEEREAAQQAMAEFQAESDRLRSEITGESVEELAERRRLRSDEFAKRFDLPVHRAMDTMAVNHLTRKPPPGPGEAGFDYDTFQRWVRQKYSTGEETAPAAGTGRMQVAEPDLQQRPSESAADLLRTIRDGQGRVLYEVTDGGERIAVPSVPEYVRPTFDIEAEDPLLAKLAQDEAKTIQEQARAQIDASGNTYAVRGTARTRMEDVLEFARVLSWAKDQHARMPWSMSALDLAVWQEHYDRAVRAYTDPFGTKDRG